MTEDHKESRHDRTPLQHEAEHSRPKKKVSVVSYLAILFAAAFLLLLLSYLMQQRSNEATISGLKDSVTSIQSVETLMDTNQRLAKENEALEDELNTLTQQLDDLQANKSTVEATLQEATQQLQAMDWFWRIQRAYSKGSRSEAKKLVAQFESNDLPRHLPNWSTAVPDGPSPADQYHALLVALGIQTAEP